MREKQSERLAAGVNLSFAPHRFPDPIMAAACVSCCRFWCRLLLRPNEAALAGGDAVIRANVSVRTDGTLRQRGGEESTEDERERVRGCK